MFTAGTALGAVLTLALVVLVGIRAGKQVKSAGDFTTGSGMGIPMIAGSLVGTLVGGMVRTGNLMWVCNRKALKISLWFVAKNYAVYFGTSSVLVFFLTKWVADRCAGYGQWIITAIPVAIVVSVAVLAVSVIFNRKQLMGILSSLLRRKRK